jgi:hypothetical protein
VGINSEEHATTVFRLKASRMRIQETELRQHQQAWGTESVRKTTLFRTAILRVTGRLSKCEKVKVR